ncbi:MAG: cold shock domain-containing protein [Rhodospirillaceae bacterium]
MIGTLDTWTDRGYGFVYPDGGGDDVFFHISELHKVLISEVAIGDRFEFELQDSAAQKPRAIKVKRVSHGKGRVYDLTTREDSNRRDMPAPKATRPVRWVPA